MNVDDGFQSRQIVNGFISFMATTYFLIVLLYSSLSMTCLFILLFYYNSREDNQIVVYSFLLILRKLEYAWLVKFDERENGKRKSGFSLSF
jgi:hypothetical protein